MTVTGDIDLNQTLRQIGAASLGEDEAEEARNAVVARYAMVAVDLDDYDRARLRDALIPILKRAGAQGPAGLLDAKLESLRGEALRAEEIARAEPDDDRGADELLDAGRPILEAGDQLADLRRTVRTLRYAGKTDPVELVYLAVHSRAFERPINLALRGPSGSGKSYTVDIALRFQPPEACHELTASSERSLIYSEEPFAHRVLVVAEAAGLSYDGIGATIIRELAWGDGGLRYETVEKVDGELRARVIEKDGPTGLITTSTKQLDPEVATRLLHVSVPDSREQTRAILTSLGERAVEAAEPAVDLDPWHAAGRWLSRHGETRVIVPFAPPLVALIPDDHVRLRRDVEQILAVVRVNAFAHQLNRPRNENGAIIATADDYETAHRLLGAVLAVTIEDVTPAQRETVEAVKELVGSGGLESVRYADLERHLDIARSTVSGRVKPLLEAGFLTNKERKPGYAAQLVPGEPLPEPRAILPEPDVVRSLSLPEGAEYPEHPNTSPETVGAQGESGVRGGVGCSGDQETEPADQRRTPEHPPNTSSSRNDGEKSGGVRVFGSNPEQEERQ